MMIFTIKMNTSCTVVIFYLFPLGLEYSQWEQPVITLSILFGKQSLGFSLLSWDGESVVHKEMESVLRRGPRVGAYILQALNEMSLMQREQTTVQLIVRSLISHCIDLLRNQVKRHLAAKRYLNR